MARCIACEKEFDVSPEEQRLIITKKMEELCMECAMQKYQETEDSGTSSYALVPRKQAIPQGPKRINWIDIHGELRAFMSIPPPKLYSANTLHRLQKPGRLHAFVFHPAPNKLASEPTLLIHSNVDRFRARNEDFWVKKVPEFYDAFTGVGKIIIPFRKVVGLEIQPEEKTVLVDDGSCVRISYTW